MAGMQPEQIQRILVIRFSSIGDIVLTTPTFRALRKRFPDARIDMVTKQQYAELVETHPALHQVFRYDSRNGFNGLLQLGRELRQIRYDLCVDLHGNLRSRILRLLAQPSTQIGYSKQILARTLLVQAKINRYRRIVPVPERYLAPLARFGVQNDGTGLELFPTEQNEAHVAKLFAAEGLRDGEPVVGFGAIAAHPLKQWPIENFIALGQRLVDQHQTRIVLFGGPGDRENAERIAQQLSNRAIVLCGRVSLLAAAAALKRCAIFIGNDTGTVHIAAAMQRPVVAIFGPTVEEFGFYPYRTPAKVISAPLPCRPCTHTGKGRCKIRDTHACMTRIRVDEVLEAAETLLRESVSHSSTFLLTSSAKERQL
ncbi:glycosyl transferase family 9 [Candidatus Moduliflexus flocculans]|uniref:lipopolysaccharide heptosyltransferase II n=1 Tax=Candidatus Moduliflexus flocculans TaxID=1499966 RepID=A0A0S6VVB7_9BACT|nr:glycosyl transferase family 9 [Candidatus Moduliflexus flocculans]